MMPTEKPKKAHYTPAELWMLARRKLDPELEAAFEASFARNREAFERLAKL